MSKYNFKEKVDQITLFKGYKLKIIKNKLFFLEFLNLNNIKKL